MGFESIITPVGMEAVEEFIKEINKTSKINKFCDIKPPHFFVYIDAGNGQTTMTEYITDMFAEGGIRHFGSIDTYLEYKLDGSMNQLNAIRTELNKSRAVYMEKYNGVVAIDVGALSTKHNEPQIPLFVDIISEMKESATFVFYIPTVTNRTLDNLVECLKNEIENTVTVILPPYSKIELTEIAKRTIENMGVMVEGKDTLAIIMKMMVEHNITTAKAAVSLGRDLIQYANFRDFNPVLELKNGDAKTMKKMVMLGGN